MTTTSLLSSFSRSRAVVAFEGPLADPDGTEGASWRTLMTDDAAVECTSTVLRGMSACIICAWINIVNNENSVNTADGI